MFSAVVGHSEDTVSKAVAQEILDQCREKLGDKRARAGLLFAGIDFDHRLLLDEINGAWPDLELIGCTTDGELSSELGFRQDSVSLLVLASDTVDMTGGVGRGMSQDMARACREAFQGAKAKTAKAPRLCLTTPEGLTTEGQMVATSLQKAVGLPTPIFGALAGDGWRMKSTRQFFGREVLRDSIPLLLLSGEFSFSYGVACGWQQAGEVGLVTRAAGATVHEIDGRPAIDFFQRYLGAAARPAAEVPLAILDPLDGIDCLRASWGEVDEAGGVTFRAAVPEGARVQLAVTDRDAILRGCLQSLSAAQSNLPTGVRPAAGLFFSGAARRILLGTRAEEEHNLIRGQLGETVPACGFYGYGEISPHPENGAGSKFHNDSFVSLLLAG
jgi:hypothetical protein